MTPDEIDAKEHSELIAIALTKDRDAVQEAANQCACDEDEDMLLGPMLDGIYASAGNKKVYVIPLDKYNYAIFIAKNFDQARDRINSLPAKAASE